MKFHYALSLLGMYLDLSNKLGYIPRSYSSLPTFLSGGSDVRLQTENTLKEGIVASQNVPFAFLIEKCLAKKGTTLQNLS